MSIHRQNYKKIMDVCLQHNVTLVAVSKTKPIADILEMYDKGQRDFGENYVQELVEKQAQLPADIRWHYIGHLQSNKAKYIAPFVHLVHAVDSEKLLAEINKQAIKNNRTISCLLQVHIAREETKFGFDASEIAAVLPRLSSYEQVQVQGLMGMASFSDDETLVRSELKSLAATFHLAQQTSPQFSILSMGMSADYMLAIEEGSTMIRIGSMLFGERNQEPDVKK